MEKKYLLYVAIGLLFVRTASAATQTNRYVVKGNVNAAPPYTNLTIAAANIQDAINAAVAANGDQVLVAAATYDTGGTKVAGEGLTNRVYISKAITVRSIDNNPATAIIQGAQSVTNEGNGSIRSVYMVAGASLIGFTVSSGSTYRAASPSGNDVNGGGIFAASASSIISNCIISGNSAYNYGGGIYYCSVFNSRIVSNSATMGAGTYSSTVSNCLVSYNAGHTRQQWDARGGAGNVSLFYNCILSYNRSVIGGTAVGGIFRNCLIYGNQVSGNYCGGVVSDATLDNCTIVGNWTGGSSAGGVMSWGTGAIRANNCIIYSNFSGTTHLNWSTNNDGSGKYGFVILSNSCTFPIQAGWDPANITNNPLFVANGSGYGATFVPGDYHLQANSPCVNRGTNQGWMSGTVDLDGRTRIRYGTVDMGAYEKIYDGTIYGIR